jgi:hypothetical protein
MRASAARRSRPHASTIITISLRAAVSISTGIETPRMPSA